MGQIIVDERGRAITADNRFPVDVGGGPVAVQLSGSTVTRARLFNAQTIPASSTIEDEINVEGYESLKILWVNSWSAGDRPIKVSVLPMDTDDGVLDSGSDTEYLIIPAVRSDEVTAAEDPPQRGYAQYDVAGWSKVKVRVKNTTELQAGVTLDYALSRQLPKE